MLPHPVPSAEGTPFGSTLWKEHIAALSKVAAGDKPKLWSEGPRWDMANIHLVFMGMYERMYLFADYAVEQDDLANYLGFAEVVLYNVYKHHQTEETVYHNKMAEAAGVDLWGKNAVDHHTFDQNLEAAMLYVRYCRQNLTPTPPPSPVPDPSQELIDVYNKYPNLDARAPFNPKVFRTHLDEVFEQFGTHMVDEIGTLSRENIEKIGEKNLEKINVGLKEVLMAHGPEWFLCSTCSACPANIIPQLLGLPWIVRWVLLPLVWGPKLSAWWRYCPYPENLTFFGKA